MSAQDESAARVVRYPRLYAVLRWSIVGALAFLAILAAAFWTLVLGGFAGGGFHAAKRIGNEDVVVTPECAWPYRVGDPDATAVCRMFYNLSPAQRAEVLKQRAAGEQAK